MKEFEPVLLQALSRDSLVQGTANPRRLNLGQMEDGTFLPEIVNLADLSHQSNVPCRTLPEPSELRGRARATGVKFVWAAFGK